MATSLTERLMCREYDLMRNDCNENRKSLLFNSITFARRQSYPQSDGHSTISRLA
jgi:hypothetical protein